MISIPMGLLGGELRNLMRLTTCHLPATNLFATLEVYHEWAAWEFSNRHEAGRMLMTAINPDFSAVMFYVL